VSRTIPLSQGKVAIVDDEDYEALVRFKWHAIRRRGLFHAVRSEQVNGKKHSIYMHRFLLGEPPGQEVDHENGDGLDNRRTNLRACTKRQNARNRVHGGSKSSRYHGVCWHAWSSRWRVVICAGPVNTRGHSKQLYVGSFKDETEAARAYDRAALQHFGPFAKPNFPKEGYQCAASKTG